MAHFDHTYQLNLSNELPVSARVYGDSVYTVHLSAKTADVVAKREAILKLVEDIAGFLGRSLLSLYFPHEVPSEVKSHSLLGVEIACGPETTTVQFGGISEALVRSKLLVHEVEA